MVQSFALYMLLQKISNRYEAHKFNLKSCRDLSLGTAAVKYLLSWAFVLSLLKYFTFIYTLQILNLPLQFNDI